MKQVLLATRPIVPPWDEASKNFAYFLGKTVVGHALTLLGAKDAMLPELPATAHLEPVYRSAHFGLSEKANLFKYLQAKRNAFDITHYLFTPTRLNIGVIRTLARPTRGKTIQTVATLRTDLYSPKTLKRLLFADHIAVYTDATKAKLESMGVTNVDRIYPGIDLDRYQPRPKSQAVLDAYYLSADDFLVVYPGEYTRLGATDFLVETLIRHFTGPVAEPFVFLFACRIKNEADQRKREAIREVFRQAGCLDRIRFEENHATTNMAEIYNTADVIAFPVGDLFGKFDVPLVIIEAYASGKPVILSDLAAFQEFSNERISVTIPRLQSKPFIDTLLHLKHSPEIRAGLGRAARTYAEEHFDLRETAKRYASLYASLPDSL